MKKILIGIIIFLGFGIGQSFSYDLDFSGTETQIGGVFTNTQYQARMESSIFNDDGTLWFYWIANTQDLYSYTLTTPFDLDTKILLSKNTTDFAYNFVEDMEFKNNILYTWNLGVITGYVFNDIVGDLNNISVYFSSQDFATYSSSTFGISENGNYLIVGTTSVYDTDIYITSNPYNFDSNNLTLLYSYTGLPSEIRNSKGIGITENGLYFYANGCVYNLNSPFDLENYTLNGCLELGTSGLYLTNVNFNTDWNNYSVIKYNSSNWTTYAYSFSSDNLIPSGPPPPEVLAPGTLTVTDNGVSISGFTTDFSGYYQGILENLDTGFITYTGDNILFGTGVNDNLIDEPLNFTQGNNYEYTIYSYDNLGLLENAIETVYSFSIPLSFIDQQGKYELTATGFYLRDILIYDDGDYSFNIFDNTNETSVFKGYYSFSSGVLSDIEVNVYGWRTDTDYAIYSNIDVIGYDTIEGPEYFFNLPSLEIFDTTFPEIVSCDLDNNGIIELPEAVVCPVVLIHHYSSKMIENLSNLKNFFVELMKLGTDEVKTFSFIGSTNANFMDGMQSIETQDNFLSKIFFFLKGFLYFIALMLVVGLIILLKQK